jgi:esterase/lipase
MSFEIKEEKKFKYVEEGSGPVLMLLHGLMGALSNFEDVINHFKQNYTVVVPIMPIFELPILDAGVKPLYKYIKEFIEFKEYDKVSMLGNSLGGPRWARIRGESPRQTEPPDFDGKFGSV